MSEGPPSRSRARRMARVAGVASVVVAGAVVPELPASAHHAHGWSQDDTHVEFARTISLIGTPGWDASTWGGNNIAVSDLDVFYQAGWTDVEASIDLFMAPNIAGRGGCVAWWDPGVFRWCDREIIQFAGWTTDGVAPEYNLADWKWLGCHEAGHTAGLDDRIDEVSCLRWAHPTPVQNQHAFLSTAEPNSDIGEINFWI